mmetsp:Transcript_128115/g.362686  ORF Transcript_128115/g.362686 Transcript_128115/m.362686 type:complete len:210 (+) Transcript_128115:778-1407(+)
MTSRIASCRKLQISLNFCSTSLSPQAEGSAGIVCSCSSRSTKRWRAPPTPPSSGRRSTKHAAHCWICFSREALISCSRTMCVQRHSTSAVSCTHLGSCDWSLGTISCRWTFFSARSRAASLSANGPNSSDSWTMSLGPRLLMLLLPPLSVAEYMVRRATSCDMRVFSRCARFFEESLSSFFFRCGVSAKRKSDASKGVRPVVAIFRRAQ